MSDARLPASRPIRTADLLAIGTELTTGETRDTNGGELAASLASAGVAVRRIVALADDMALVTAHVREALEAVDLIVLTGGLGPTPDDLTREAVAAALREEPAVDPALEAWLRELFAGRGTRLLDVNLKQAWLIPSAAPIPNGNGTAPGWWVEARDGRVAVLLPGPPREMRPMWQDWVLPRLHERGLGDGRVVRTLRTYGIGESAVIDRLGDAWLRRANPVVATYAGADWLDIRITAVDEPAVGGAVRPATRIVDETAAHVRERLPGHVWAEGRTSWGDVAAEVLDSAGASLATVESGTRGQLALLLADVPRLRRAISLGIGDDDTPGGAPDGGIEASAIEVARGSGAALGLSLVARETSSATAVRVAVASAVGGWDRSLELDLFQRGPHGRLRAAVAAAAFLAEVVRGAPEPGTHGSRRA